MPRDRGNTFSLEGNLCADPAPLGSGDNRGCRFSLAVTTSYWSKKDEKRVDETAFVYLTAWGNIAKRCVKLNKGAGVIVEGFFQTSEDKDGKSYTNQQITSISRMRYLPDAGEGGSSSSSSNSSSKSEKNDDDDDLFA